MPVAPHSIDRLAEKGGQYFFVIVLPDHHFFTAVMLK